MNDWTAIRTLARQKHEELISHGEDYSADQLLAKAQEVTGITCRPVAPGDPILAGGLAILEPESDSIFFNSDLDPSLIAYLKAHEFGHHWQDEHLAKCYPEALNLDAIEDFLSVGVAVVEGYSPHERHEVEANVFAREFLMPSQKLYKWFVEDGMNSQEIAEKLGVLEAIAHHQLMHLLLPIWDKNFAKQKEESPQKPISLDKDQLLAAHALEGPLLVEAGPGTGKTSTLQGRIHYLVEDQGVDPTSILTLTFSNKAAEEIRARIGLVVPDAAPHIWMGTFHAYGLELLRKYGSNLGLSNKPTVVDQAAAVLLLERNLDKLELNYYLNLRDPAQELAHILGAISRAKDELVSPERYYELAQSQLEAADNEDDVQVTEKALEVAGVYKVYEELLLNEGAIDFGDLICKTVYLLQKEPTIREKVQNDLTHILVDEFQDVNHASALLLKEIVGNGKGLWVVGDARQSIYRFRGAEPRNVSDFPVLFPGAKVKALGTNYRSLPAIVSTISSFAKDISISGSVDFKGWEAFRSDEPGRVAMDVSDDFEDEVDTLANHIKELHKSGVAYQNQAVLCGSHTTLGRIASLLESHNIPILYIGDLFEREEIRNLLSLLSFTSEIGGAGLIRVAQLPEYQIPIKDVMHFLNMAQEKGEDFPKFLTFSNEVSELSEQGRIGLGLLRDHLADVTYSMNAWTVLTLYLFRNGDWIRSLLQDSTVAGMQQRLAIHQFLAFVYAYRLPPEGNITDPKRWFLETVRRLQALGETKRLRGIPDGAEAIDAVRLMTLHASKGLEFPVVFLPYLGRGKFPFPRRGMRCPPPIGMLSPSLSNWQQDEEACLFFVAISRARDQLFLSRATSYGRRSSNHLPLLDTIANNLPPGYEKPGKKPLVKEEQLSDLDSRSPGKFPVRELESYIRCGRRYLYNYVLILMNNNPENAYGQMHKGVLQALDWYKQEQKSGREISEAELSQVFEEAWLKFRSEDHPFEKMYREYGRALLDVAQNIGSTNERYTDSPIWEIERLPGTIIFQPDQIAILDEEKHIVRRLTTGRIKKDPDIDAVYVHAAQDAFGLDVTIEVHSLSRKEELIIGMSEKKQETRLGHYDRAMLGIQRGEFIPKSSPWCPSCPYYFICPAPSIDQI